MIGEKRIKIKKQKIVYDFVLKRNITVIKGDSATGKTTLLEYINDFERENNKSGIEIDSNGIKLHVLTKVHWEENLKMYNNSIIFIDEANDFVNKVEFSKTIQKSSNYFVIITREKLANISYSVEEIYGIKCSGNRHTLEKMYNINKNKWFEKEKKIEKFDKIITEDRASGFQFFNYFAKNNEIICESAITNSKVEEKVVDENEVIIVDGAAFGPYMEECVEKIKLNKKAYLYLPESFEWIILVAKIFKNMRIKNIIKKPIKNIKDNDYTIDNILNNPIKYIDSKEYMSWEKFFNDMLTSITKGDKVKKYEKSKIKKFYLEKQNMKKIIGKINGIII